MTKYELLVKVLDKLCQEAPPNFKLYHPDPSNVDAVSAARSRAFVHLLLKVYFGLLTFEERHAFMTEGSGDGGVDAYFIDRDRRIIYFIQSKFRQSESNFESKHISAEDLLKMDVDRMLNGERNSETGIPYNSKIQQMLEAIHQIEDIGRYQSRVIILANAKGVTQSKLRALTGGFNVQLIDHEECYKALLFPLLAGTYYTAEFLRLSIDLAGKYSSEISYTVATEFAECNITVIFVPTLEVAKAMYKYRNSILRFNPRSYLGHEGRQVNSAIRGSIESKSTNEFALFNNGITVLSDETSFNKQIGRQDRAQLVVTNPQIINGGQTAYTLSVIYRERLASKDLSVFEGKEVLFKIITFASPEVTTVEKKVALIEAISRATNQQTAVSYADRRSNEQPFQDLQSRLFETTGLLLERKRGEFEDGIREGYVDPQDVLDRTFFFRAALATTGDSAATSRRKLVARLDYSTFSSMSDDELKKTSFAVHLMSNIVRSRDDRTLRISQHVVDIVYGGVRLYYRSTMTPREQRAKAGEVAWKLRRAVGITFAKWARAMEGTGSKSPAADRAKYVASDAYLGHLEEAIAGLPPIEATKIDGIQIADGIVSIAGKVKSLTSKVEKLLVRLENTVDAPTKEKLQKKIERQVRRLDVLRQKMAKQTAEAEL